MSNEVYITGIGPVTALGLGIEDNWDALGKGESAIAPVKAFDASKMASTLAAEVPAFKIRDYVPKCHRKATKVMAADIKLAVAGAHLAAKDAALKTRGNAETDETLSYAPDRVGCHIGAGLISADLDELTAALAKATHDDGSFDIHAWGSEGMTNLTPLWLLKYLPNMLSCHVTIIHDTQGPSNTITCAEASGILSFGESLRVIQRGDADCCFCGGAESNLNPMSFIRQVFTDRLSKSTNPKNAALPFDESASGAIVGEGGGILVLELKDTFEKRNSGTKPYGVVLGFGASQSVNRATRSLSPQADGRGPRQAIEAALREANLKPEAIDAVFPLGCGHPTWDASEAAAMRSVFGDRLKDIPVVSAKGQIGNCSAGAGAIDLALAAHCLREQALPPIANRDNPLDGLGATTTEKLDHVLVFTTGFGGQNAAVVLGKA